MALIERVLARSLEQMDDARRVAEALPRARGPAVVIAVGKAAPAMAAGALGRWGKAIESVVVVTNDGTDVSAIDDPRVEVMRASHPKPDKRSVRAAERCLEVAHACGERKQLLLVLVSGGASAMLCAPAKGVSLTDKQRVTSTMLGSAASIQELNVVRKHLSRIKGGGLARAAAPARVITLATSDVIGGAIDDIGSGPASTDPSSVTEARRLLRKYAARYADLPLARTGRAKNVGLSKIIASPEELARIAASELKAAGMRTRVLPPSQAPAAVLAREYVALAKRGGAIAYVRAAEPSVEVDVAKPGRGGRSTHLAALVGASLPAGATFVAAATDGVDGLSDTGGAMVDGSFLRRAGEVRITRALEHFDTGTLHRAMKTALPLRPSGQNLADLHLLIVR